MGPEGPKWGREVLFPTNPDLADILGRTDFDFDIFLIFWKPLTADYVAAGAFSFSRKMAPVFLEALNLWVRCRRRLFFPQKRDPYFWKP